MQNSTKKIFILAGLTVLTLVLGVVAVVTATKLRQLATVPVAPNVPQSQPLAQTSEPQCSADIMVVLDRSGSMSINQPPTGKDKWTFAKEATDTLIDTLESDYNNTQGTVRVGLVSYVMEEEPLPMSAHLDQTLTSDFNQFRSTLDALTVISTMVVPRTCLDCGLKTGNDELVSKARAGVKKYMLFLSDGRGNRVGDESSNVGSVPVQNPYTGAGLTTIQNAAIARVTEGRGNGVEYNVLGFGEYGEPGNGSTVIESTLKAIANDPDAEHYYYEPDPAQWSATFVKILNDMCPPEPTQPPKPGVCIKSFTIPPRTCAQSCATDADCGMAGSVQLKCSSGMCLNPACTTNKTDCVCTTPETCFIQGVKVISPANNKWGNNTAVEKQTVRLDDGAKTNSAQPYNFTELVLGTSHKVSVDVPSGYKVGYSVCYNRVDCHTQAQNVSVVWKDNDKFVCPTTVATGTKQGYVDLWWHFEPLPTGVPEPTPTSTPGPTATPGPTNTPTPASHGTAVVAPTSPPPQLPTAGATLPSIGLLGMGGLMLILGLVVILL